MFIWGRLCGAFTSVLGFRVQSFVGPTFVFSFFDVFFIYVILWPQWSITFIGKLY